MKEILVVHVTKDGPQIINVPLELEAMQKLVGGYLETFTPYDVADFAHRKPGIQIVCNEQGMLEELPVRWIINGERIHGDFFITRGPDGESEDFEGLAKDTAVALVRHMQVCQLAATSGEPAELDLVKNANEIAGLAFDATSREDLPPASEHSKSFWRQDPPRELCTRCGKPMLAPNQLFRVETVDGFRHEVCPES